MNSSSFGGDVCRQSISGSFVKMSPPQPFFVVEASKGMKSFRPLYVTLMNIFVFLYIS